MTPIAETNPIFSLRGSTWDLPHPWDAVLNRVLDGDQVLVRCVEARHECRQERALAATGRP